jgi:hypothetical protein
MFGHISDDLVKYMGVTKVSFKRELQIEERKRQSVTQAFLACAGRFGPSVTPFHHVVSK